MARSALSPSALTANGAVAAAGTAVDVANGMRIASSRPEMTVLVVSNTHDASHNITIAAGDPVTGLGYQAALVAAVPAESVRYVGPFESARYKQADGSLSIDFASGFTGTITALLIPRGV